MQSNVESLKPVMPPVPEGCPKASLWSITVQHHRTKERQTKWIRFTGPHPLKDELDYYCPPSVWAVAEMKFLYMVPDDE